MSKDRSYEHFVTALPIKLIDNHHYYLRKTATLSEHYVGAKDGNAVLVGSLNSQTNNIVLYKAGENINSHTPVCLIGDYLYKLNNLDNSHGLGFIGFTKTSVLANGFVELEKEEIELLGWGLIQNEIYLAGSNGNMQVGINSNNGFTQILGVAQTNDKLFIKNNIQSILK